jgi:hypothetical protein
LVRVFRADSRLGGAKSDEGIEVFRRPEGVYFEAGFRWNAGGEYMPEGRDQPCDVIFNWKKKYDG